MAALIQTQYCSLTYCRLFVYIQLHCCLFSSIALSPIAMDELVSELNKEVVRARPKRRLKDSSVELGKQLEERLSRLQRDIRICKKPKSTADKPRTLNREYIYSGCSIQPRNNSTRTRAKASSSKVTEESVTGLISAIN